MSSLLRRMQKNSGKIGTHKVGKYVGLRYPECACCAAKELRNARKLARKGGHTL